MKTISKTLKGFENLIDTRYVKAPTIGRYSVSILYPKAFAPCHAHHFEINKNESIKTIPKKDINISMSFFLFLLTVCMIP